MMTPADKKTSGNSGVDISAAMIKHARKHAPYGAFTQTPGATLPFENEPFDLVYAITVLPHMPADQQAVAVREMVRVVRSGGLILSMEDILARKPDPNQAIMTAHLPSQWINLFEKEQCRTQMWWLDKHFFFYSIFDPLILWLTRLEPRIAAILPKRIASGMCASFTRISKASAPWKLGIMARHLAEQGGIGVYFQQPSHTLSKT